MIPKLHHFVVSVSTVLLAGMTGMVLLNMASSVFEPMGETVNGIAITGWIALVMNLLLVVACLRETFGKYVPAFCYVVGMIALTQLITQLPIPPHALAMVLAIGLAAYACLAGITLELAARRPSLQGILQDNTFVPYANISLTLLSMFLAIGVSVRHPSLSLRAAVCVTPLLGALALSLLQHQVRWQVLRSFILTLLCSFPLLASWIWIMPDDAFSWQSRVIGFIEAFTCITLVLAMVVKRLPRLASDVVLPKGVQDWHTVIRQCMMVFSPLACLSILFISSSQLHMLMTKQSLPLTQPMVIGLIVSYAVLIVLLLLFAVHDRFDVLVIPAASKGVYVYIAQVLGGILALHIRVSMPWLFHGFVTQYWPLAALGIAVAGIAVGEMCCRRKLTVVGIPFVRTGMWLPLVACFELFAGVSRIHYSLVLLSVGAIYAVLSVMKKSFVMGMLATVVLNGSLWYLLHHTPGLGITEHPQLWIIPLAIAVLTAGYLNRHQLTTEQSRMIHYGCLLGIYLSSTLDVFLIGVAQAPWLPLVLAGLSIIGIFIGLARHIRSYLFLGTGFLCLSLLTMIWHAASNLGWTWIWYVAGIALGVGIITVFALFEKKKNEMSKVIDEVKDWEG